MLTARTKLVGLIGNPVEHSLSPAMQNAAFAARGLDWAYLPLRVEDGRVEDAVRGLVALGFAGANVTAPHKAAAAAARPFSTFTSPISGSFTGAEPRGVSSVHSLPSGV